MIFKNNIMLVVVVLWFYVSSAYAGTTQEIRIITQAEAVTLAKQELAQRFPENYGGVVNLDSVSFEDGQWLVIISILPPIPGNHMGVVLDPHGNILEVHRGL